MANGNNYYFYRNLFNIITISKDTTREIVQYLVLIVASMGICVAPIFFMQSPSIEPRMSMSIGGIVGMSLIYLITSKQDYNIIKIYSA